MRIVETIFAPTPQHVLLLFAELGERVLGEYALEKRVVVLESIVHVDTLVLRVVVRREAFHQRNDLLPGRIDEEFFCLSCRR